MKVLYLTYKRSEIEDRIVEMFSPEYYENVVFFKLKFNEEFFKEYYVNYFCKGIRFTHISQHKGASLNVKKHCQYAKEIMKQITEQGSNRAVTCSEPFSKHIYLKANNNFIPTDFSLRDE